MAIKFACIDETSKEIAPFDPITASMPADIGGYYFPIKTGDGSFVLVPDISFLKKTDETVLDTGEQTAAGVALTRTYSIRIPCDMIVSGKVMLFGKSGALNTVAANTGDTARVNLNLLKNGAVITGVTKANGTDRIPNNTVEQNYTEILSVDLPSTTFTSGDTLDVVVELEITAVDAVSPGIQFKLYSDPATSGNELVVYLQVT